MGWKIGDKPTIEPQDSDYILTEQGGNTRNTTWSLIKGFLLGTESLETTSKTIKGSINEVNAAQAQKADDMDNARTTTSKTITGAINELNSEKINKTSIVNNLTATVAGSVLDATQGKVLNNLISNLFCNEIVLSNVNDAPYGISIASASATANTPFSFWSTILTIGRTSSSTYKQQIAFPWAAGEVTIKYRIMDSGTWGGWKIINLTA